MGKKKKKKPGPRVLATNRKALRDYHIIERYEAGLSLLGTEVKSLRNGSANLKEAYCRIRGGEIWLVDCHISPYSHGASFNHDPVRPRRMLLTKREIKRLTGAITEKGFTLVPLKFYLKGPLIKLEIALARGKRMYSKRETIRRRDIDRDTERAMKEWK